MMDIRWESDLVLEQRFDWMLSLHGGLPQVLPS
jgi:hypothetical protein